MTTTFGDLESAYAAASASPPVPQRKRKRGTHIAPPAPPPTFAEAERVDVEARTELLSTLVRDAPAPMEHTQAAVARLPAARARLTAAASNLLRAPLQVTAAPGVEELLRRRARLVQPRFRVEGQVALPSTHDACHQMRMRALSVPIQGAAHESRQLIQAGTFGDGEHRRTLPPCMFGAACVASTYPIEGLTEPIVLMRTMSPTQLARLLATNEQPPGRAPCVLCHRNAVEEYVYYVRAMAMQPPAHATLQLEHAHPDEVLQLWCNKVDCDDGYVSRYVLRPLGGGTKEIVVEPMCCVTGHGIRAHEHRAGEPWRLDQSRLVWRPPEPLEPHIGERVSDFSNGAARSRSTSSTTNTYATYAPRK